MFTSTLLGSSLVLLATTQLVVAQGSLNLTLTFFPDEDNTCSNDASKAVSFSTAVYPLTQSCFNLDEIFASASQGGTRNTSSTGPYGDDDIIRWVTTNVNSWDPSGNYSHIRYEQLNPTGNDDDGKLTWSSRRVNIYNGNDCLQVSNPEDKESLSPWIGWTCHSTEEDHCRQAPFNIKSFFIIPIDEDDEDRKCLDFAVNGDGARSFPHALGALVSIVVTGFFLF